HARGSFTAQWRASLGDSRGNGSHVSLKGQRCDTRHEAHEPAVGSLRWATDGATCPGPAYVAGGLFAGWSLSARLCLWEALEPVVGDRLPRSGIGHVGAPSGPHARIAIESSQAYADPCRIHGATAE